MIHALKSTLNAAYVRLFVIFIGGLIVFFAWCIVIAMLIGRVTGEGEILVYASYVNSETSYLYMVDVDRQLSINITPRHMSQFSPVWSRDGAKMAYLENRDTIAIRDMTHGTVTKFPNYITANILDLQWTYDPNHVMYLQANDIFSHSLCTLDIALAKSTCWDESYLVNHYSISPDGMKLLYIPELGNENLAYVYDLITEERHSITLATRQYFAMMSWSGDNRSVVLSAGDSLYIVDTVKRDLQLFAFNPDENYWNASWSPYSDKILYNKIVGVTCTLMLYDIATDTHNAIGNEDLCANRFTWSSNGRDVYFYHITTRTIRRLNIETLSVSIVMQSLIMPSEIRIRPR